MAKVIDSKVESDTVNASNPVWLSALIGAVMGLLFWLLTLYISRLTDSETIPGDVATILVATTATVLMVRFRMVRPLLISLAVAVSLWGLAGWVEGLEVLESVAWIIGLYTLAYIVFSWLVKYTKLTIVLFTLVVVVALVRLVIFL